MTKETLFMFFFFFFEERLESKLSTNRDMMAIL